MDLNTLTIKQAHEDMKNGVYTAVELTEAYLAVIAQKNEDLNVYVEVFDDCLEQAKKADEIFKNGTATLLSGIPIAVKDNILIQGRKTTAASKILDGYTASYDAYVIRKLKDAGAVFLGRTNMDEFAMGGSTENSAYGPTKNPLDTSRVPGGSSGGSAAAVAAHMALVALGSDTGGSVRQPASFCGIAGLKPTYGSVSRSGLIAMGSSLDQIGTLGKTAEDAHILYEAIVGNDPKDSTSRSVPNDIDRTEKETYTIGVPTDLLDMEGVDPTTKEAFQRTLNAYTAAGHTIIEISLPHFTYALASYYIIMFAESSTNLARFDGVRYGNRVEGDDGIADFLRTRGHGFGKEVRRRILLGTYVLSAGYKDAYYNKAAHVRELIGGDLAHAFTQVDAIAIPTAPASAFKIGEKINDPVQMYLEDIFTVPVNLSGVPALSIPAAPAESDESAMPVGFQLLAPHFHEHTLYALGKQQ